VLKSQQAYQQACCKGEIIAVAAVAVISIARLFLLQLQPAAENVRCSAVTNPGEESLCLTLRGAAEK